MKSVWLAPCTVRLGYSSEIYNVLVIMSCNIISHHLEYVTSEIRVTKLKLEIKIQHWSPY
jgi:hypothetical protein